MPYSYNQASPTQQSYQMPAYPTYSQQTHVNNSMIWVQGIEGAKAYNMPPGTLPGTAIPLWDSEEQCIYIKVFDASGIPQPLRILDYTERAPQPDPNSSDYITTSQLNDILDKKFAELTQALQQRPNNYKKGGHGNGKSSVQSAES